LKTGPLIALGLIGYAVYKFTQSSKPSGYGSPLTTSGTAKVPNVLGAAKPGSAPTGGYSTGGINGSGSQAAAPAGGVDILPLIRGAADLVSGWFRRSPASTAPSSPTTQSDEYYRTPGIGESAGNTSAARDDASLYVPVTNSPAHTYYADDNATDGSVDYLDFQGVDELDTSNIGAIA
jgi:hypothetical protein